ncbi:hypothetical protein F0P96_08740 [Hymenobacter busanensis]|uniref:Uncharacterized protein n=1 Tax=Hymenobacter busanensis TaxID=2607656 RepID=A0A7L4ZXN0_9BACT|nr:hypothetical protein [Hymenobacter busanensis]KAA9333061.1 hypothetical protein F0P96_08740 [Hymenobacter busanensis]QHJ08264.1 hypothetical protein GUY19_13585 [Hymenobacter busanensis]
MKHDLPSSNEPNYLISRQRASLSMWLLLLLAFVLLLVQRAQAQTVVRVGNGGDFPTLTQALATVPATPATPYELRLVSGSTFTEDVLINVAGSASAPLTIKPETGAVGIVLEGTVTFGASARYVTLSGHNGSTARQFTVRQSSASQPALLFAGDAQNNVARDLQILGNNALSSGGVVEFGATTSVGNDDNTLTSNLIGNASASQLPANLVYAANASATALNDRVAIINNELMNYAQTGIKVGSGNGDAWIIRDNSFYYNLATPATTAQTAINFAPGAGSDNNTLSGNYIGGTSAQAGGASSAMWQNAGAQTFNGIVVSCGSATGAQANVVENNTVRNISLSQPSTQSFQALLMAGGRSELTGNAVNAVSNNGTAGVNALVSQAQVVLNAFTVAAGQVMSIQNGETIVTGNLVIQGTLNHTGGDIVVNGDFTNTGAFAQTLGNLEVKGNMNNYGVFSCTTGGVLLTGAGNQTVSGGLYYNLEVRGGGVKTLTDDVTLANNLVMSTGILQTGPANKIKLNSDALLTETNTSYVLGNIEARRNPQAGATEIFGNLGLALTPQPGSTLPGLTIVTRVTGTAANGSGHQGIKRYFDISAPAYSGTGMNVQMRIDYLAHELGTLQPADLTFYKSSDNGGTWQPKGRTSGGTTYAILNGVDGFSRWTLGRQQQPLPVNLTAYQVRRQQNDAVLTWTTASEINNRGYGVEVSTDGLQYRELAFVPGVDGGSTSSRNYRYLDREESKQGTRYYRLRQVDLNGKVTYYGPRAVAFDGKSGLLAYPTVFERDIALELNMVSAGVATLTLNDMSGRPVWVREQELPAGRTKLNVQPECARGGYILVATLNGQNFQQRLLRK